MGDVCGGKTQLRRKRSKIVRNEGKGRREGEIEMDVKEDLAREEKKDCELR